MNKINEDIQFQQLQAQVNNLYE